PSCHPQSRATGRRISRRTWPPAARITTVLSSLQGVSPLMLVVLTKNYEEVSREAARIVAGAVRSKPDIVLGLATGGTPLGLYKELITLYRDGSLDFSRATSFNLDEYLGLEPSHPQSYHHFMEQNLFSQVNFSRERAHVPDGTIRG